MKFVDPIKDLNQIKKLHAYFRTQSERDYLFLVLGLNTTLRISDLLSIRVSNLLNRKGIVKEHLELKERKTGKRRRIFINSGLRDMISSYIIENDLKSKNFIFFSEHDKRKHIDRIRAWRILKKAAKECGIKENIGTHSLRKTFAYQAYLETKDIALIMKELNHSSLENTKRYLGLTQDKLDELHKKVIL